MYEHGVAHMDLKPHNIVIPLEEGRLSIIDFSTSIHVRSPSTMYKGVVGTKDYMTPEVHQGQYKPILANLWSCGKMLEELSSGCCSSADHVALLQISRELMNEELEACPRISTVLEWMASLTRQGDDIVSL